MLKRWGRCTVAAAVGVCWLQMSVCAASGNSAVGFLELMPSARAAGVGETFLALVDDASAIIWNPAALGRIEGVSTHLSSVLYVQGVNYHFAGAALGVPGWGTVGVGAALLQSGEIPATSEDAFGNLVEGKGNFSVGMSRIHLGWGRPLTPHVRVGVAGKWFQQQIDDVGLSGWAFDVGVLVELPLDLVAAATYYHLGPSVGGFPLPATLRVGAALPLSSFPLTIAIQFQAQGGMVGMGGGVEYTIGSAVLRAGYVSGVGTGGISGLHGGAGFQFRAIGVDYALVPLGDLGSAHHLSVNLAY